MLNSALRNNTTLLWLALVMLLAVTLRFFGLEFQSYWYDELFSAHVSKPEHSFTEVIDLTLGDVHPPFYQLAMWLSYKVFGYTEWAGRFPSALLSSLTVGVIFLLGREMFSKRVGLYAAAFAAVNYFLVYYGQEARAYAFMYFLCSLSFLFFVRTLRYDSSLNLVGYILAVVSLIYTHHFGLLVLVAQGLCALLWGLINGWSDKLLLRRAGIAIIVIVLAVIPLIPSVLGHSEIDDWWITQAGPGFIANYFYHYFNQPQLALAMALLVALGVTAGLSSRRSRWERLALLFLLVWLFVGYGLPYLRGFIGQPVLLDRNTIMLVPPLLILAAYGLANIPSLLVQRIIVTVLVGFSLWFLVFGMEYYATVKKNQYRDTVAVMNAFEPTLPVYTFKDNHRKYNVYFRQQQSDLFALDELVLEELLADGIAPPVMWFADAHLRVLQSDIDDRYGLLELGRIRYKGTVAAVMLDPAKAVRLTLAQEDAGWKAAVLPASGVLYISAEQGAEIEVWHNNQVIQRAAVAEPGNLPVTVVLDTLPVASSIAVVAETMPQVWLVSE